MTHVEWSAILGLGGVGGATLVVACISDAAERRRAVIVELGKGRYKCATLFQRYVAQLLDAAILAVTVLVPANIRGECSVFLPRGPCAALAGAVLALAYFVVFEACWGQTPGKRLVRIRVAGADARTPDWRASAVRNLARLADAFFLGYAVGVAVWWRSRERQRIGDQAARTWVVAEGVVGEDGVPAEPARAVADPAAVQG